MKSEVDWDIITKDSNSESKLIEYTTVTNKVRRVGRFEPTIVREAISVNKPTKIILNHLDYIDRGIYGKNVLNKRTNRFIDYIEQEIKKKVDFVGTSEDLLMER